MRILVTGGAGYVGSVSAAALLAAGHEVTVLDTLVTGHAAAVPEGAPLEQATYTDTEAVAAILGRDRIDAVLHCGARSLVGESMQEPALYYHENVVGGIALLDAMIAARVDRIVFSSTAAVYGIPDASPIDEDAPLRPINTYGATKVAFEGALRWYGAAHGLRSVSLRYFNVAGATDAHGEDHATETHLVPNILGSVDGGSELTIFGTDYPTPDGTCIRDYIHVSDLADAHLAALEVTALHDSRSAAPLVLNLGSGGGFSVREVLTAAEAVVGRPIPHRVGPRREGDPPVLVASNSRAAEVLGWQPRRSTLEEMIGSAWAWRRAHPGGYEG
jgi:UDP-glucose 4-epimerase